MPRLSRTALILAAATILVTLGVAAPANAAPSPKGNAPAASATAGTPDEDTITIDYAINRGAQAIANQTCDLDGTPVACDDAADTTTKKASTFSVDLTDLADGDHVFTVAFTLTGGGSAAASAEFVIDAAMTPLEAACASLTGTLTTYDDGYWFWTCVSNPYTGEFTNPLTLLIHGTSVLAPFCERTVAGGATNNEESILRADWGCPRI